MFEIINTYPKKDETAVNDVRISAARAIYKELVRLLEKKTELPCNT